MRFFKVSVELGGRKSSCVVREGVMATIEVGSHIDKAEKPEHKASIIVQEGRDGLVAWVQTATFADGKILTVATEGWLSPTGNSQSISSFDHAPTGLFVEIDSNSEEARKCAAETTFGPLACCTAYGNGCYVRCCGGCCSDPVRCPGASCCG